MSLRSSLIAPVIKLCGVTALCCFNMETNVKIPQNLGTTELQNLARLWRPVVPKHTILWGKWWYARCHYVIWSCVFAVKGHCSRGCHSGRSCEDLGGGEEEKRRRRETQIGKKYKMKTILSLFFGLQIRQLYFKQIEIKTRHQMFLFATETSIHLLSIVLIMKLLP